MATRFRSPEINRSKNNAYLSAAVRAAEQVAEFATNVNAVPEDVRADLRVR